MARLLLVMLMAVCAPLGATLRMDGLVSDAACGVWRAEGGAAVADAPAGAWQEAMKGVRLEWPAGAGPKAGMALDAVRGGGEADVSVYEGVRLRVRGRGPARLTALTRRGAGSWPLSPGADWGWVTLPFAALAGQAGAKPDLEGVRAFRLAPAEPAAAGWLELSCLELYTGSEAVAFETAPACRPAPGPRLNQVGYLPASGKVFTVAASAAGPGAAFAVEDGSGKTVYQGVLDQATVRNEAGAEDLRLGDFSALAAPGTYRVVVGAGRSAAFEVGGGVYAPLFRDALRTYPLNRCNTAVDDPVTGLRHDACHMDDHKADDGSAGDFTGGWHNAGDYGKWCHETAFSVAHFLYLRELKPALKARAVDAPGNRGPDALGQEAAYGLAFLMRLKRPDGSFFHKVDTEPSFCFGTPPERDPWPHLARYAAKPSTVDAASACAALALGARTVGGAKQRAAWAAAARQAWAWCLAHPNLGQADPYYRDPDPTGELCWAAAEMYRLTGARDCLDKAMAWHRQAPVEAPTWINMHGLALTALLTDPKLPAEEREELLAGLATWADQVSAQAAAAVGPLAAKGRAGSARGPADMFWGSVYHAFQQAGFLLQAHHFLGKPAYLAAALAQMDWALGNNALDRCLVTGHGERRVEQPYHWACAAYHVTIPGWISGGPNNRPEGADGLVKALIGQGCPPELCWVDGTQSWASNEGATDGECALVFSAGWLSLGAD